MYRRRLLMQFSQYCVEYFGKYKVRNGDINGLKLQWFTFEKSNQFQLERYLELAKHQEVEMSLANFQRYDDILEPSTTLLPMGYDSNKKYNIRIKVLNKSIDEGYNVEDFNGNGSFMFLFKGLDVIKSSQSINIRDIDQGTEFIIPIEQGEILNNFCVKYVSDTINDEDDDYYPCRILFEIYFEKITE